MQQLLDLRKQIDAVNTLLVTLLNERARLAEAVGRAKQGKHVYHPSREADILASVIQQNEGPLSNEALQAIFREVIGACRNLERQLRVAYLGPEGTYSEEAARLHTGTTSTFIPAKTIAEVVQMVATKQVDVAVVPIENSSEGPVHQTLDLLLDAPVQLCGEVQLLIHHQLISQATVLSEITEVVAHPQALAQCSTWLSRHLPHAIQTACNSNAEGVQRAAWSRHLAAIASKRAADVYELPILASNIEDEANNTTRFVVLGDAPTTPTGNDKTSLICSVPNQPGTLHVLLGLLAAEGVNLTSLQSRPASHALWDYMFYIDIDGHQTDAAVQRALQAITANVSFLKVLGSYPKAGA